MDEGVAMVVRHLIVQIQELCELHVSPPPFNHSARRWYFPGLDKSSMDDGYLNCIMKEKFGSSETNKSPAKKSRREKKRKKMSSTAGSTELMDQRIWKEFPEELFEAVVARLPIAAIFRFQSVCRKWDSLLTSPTFSQHCAEVPRRQHPWFYTINHEVINSGAMYDPFLKKWHHPSIPSLPSEKICFPVTSAGGLVCFMDVDHRNFYICNPLTRSFKKLPARDFYLWSRVAVGMILNGKSTSSGYKVMWLGCNGDHEIYDSVQECWVRPGIMPSCIKLPLCLNYKSQALSIDSTLYFMRSAPDGIVSYDVASGVWKQFVIPSPSYLNDYTLAECGGQLMLIGLLTKNAATCVCIWELQKMTLLWKEVDRMPNIWCLEFYGKHVQMSCLGNRGLLMLSLRSRQMNRLVTYDVSRREWQKVPGCIHLRGRKRHWIAWGISFHPCPTDLA